MLQHVGCEPPGFYEEEMDSAGVSIDRVVLGDGSKLPARFDGYEGIVVMGGPMGALDDRDHPWLAPERSFIGAAVRQGMPYLGVCLGAQLLAASLGAAVMRGPRPEVGVAPVALTEDAGRDPLFRGLPDRFDCLHWHNDTFELPPGSTLLASSELYRNQAFRWGAAWGLQFHLEVSGALSREWFDLPAYSESARSVLGADAARIPDDVATLEEANRPLARALFRRWLGVAREL